MPRPSTLASEHARTQRQRGAVMIMTAGFMLLGVLCLALVVDTGRLYMEKRSLQRVADVVALEVASLRGCVSVNGSKPAEGLAQIALSRLKLEGNAEQGTSPVSFVRVRCGVVTPNKDILGGPRIFQNGGSDAVEVVISHDVLTSLVAGGIFKGKTTLTATAVAARPSNPLARLMIRNSLASVDSEQSAILNSVVNKTLGSNLSIDALGWKGLADANISLVDLIGVDGLKLGYEELLTTNLTLSQLATSSISVLNKQSPKNTAAISALDSIKLIISPLTVNLGNLLGLQTGLPESAADVNLNVLDLILASVQLFSKNNAIDANVPIPLSIVGLGNLNIQAKVIEPPQLSSIGDPRDINRGAGFIGSTPYTPKLANGDIFVSTAQAKSLISLNLNGLPGTLDSLLAGTELLDPVITLLKGEKGILGNVVDGLAKVLTGFINICSGATCPWTNIVYAEAGTIDVGLNVGGASSYVTDHSCSSAKTLSAKGNTEIGRVYIGKISDFFGTATVTPAPILELGYRQRRYSSCFRLQVCLPIFGCSLGVGECKDPVWKKGAGTHELMSEADKFVLAGIGVKTPDGGTPLVATASNPDPLVFKDPPELKLPSEWQHMNASDSINALSKSIATLEIKAYTSSGGGVLNNIVLTTLNTVSGLVGSNGALPKILAGIATALDPIIDRLLKALGVNLANAEVGANLSCQAGDAVELVN